MGANVRGIRCWHATGRCGHSGDASSRRIRPCPLYVVTPPRLERGTYSLEGCCSIQLSYGANPCCDIPSRPDGTGLQGFNHLPRRTVTMLRDWKYTQSSLKDQQSRQKTDKKREPVWIRPA